MGVGDAHRLEHVFFQETLVVLAADDFHDAVQDAEAHVAVVVGFSGTPAGIGILPVVDRALDQRVGGNRRAVGIHAVRPGEGRVTQAFADAAAVAEQMPYGNGFVVGGDVLVDALENAFLPENLLVEFEPPLLLEPHDAQGAELLGDAGHPEEMVGRHAHLGALVGEAVATGIFHLRALHDRDRDARDTEVAHELVHLVVDVRVAQLDKNPVVVGAVAGFGDDPEVLHVAREIADLPLLEGLAVQKDLGSLRDGDAGHQTGKVRTFRHSDTVIIVDQHSRGTGTESRIITHDKGKVLE